MLYRTFLFLTFSLSLGVGLTHLSALLYHHYVHDDGPTFSIWTVIICTYIAVVSVMLFTLTLIHQ